MAYELPIDSKGLETLIKGFKEAAAGAREVHGAVKDMNGALNETRTPGGRAVAMPQNPADRARSRSIGPSDPVNAGTTPGSRQILMREEERLRRMEAIGDHTLIRDQQARVARARKRVASDDKLLDEAPDKPKSREQLLAEMFMSSRFDPTSGKLFPLVNKALAAAKHFATPEGAAEASQILKALGIGVGKNLAPAIMQAATAALPLIAGGGITAVAGGGMLLAAQAGSARMRAANNAFYTLGGSSSAVGQALALGGEDAAQKAMQLSDRLREGTYGAAFLRGRGIIDTGPYQIDKSANYIKSLDALRGVKDIQQRIRIARDVGLTDDLWTADLSDYSYRRLKGSMMGAGSEGERRSQAEYEAQKRMFGNNWDRVVRTVGKDAMGATGDAFGQASGDGASWASQAKRGGRLAAGAVFGPAIGAVLDGIQTNLEHRNDKKQPGKKSSGAGFQDRTMKDGADVPIGSMSGVIPAGWRGQYMTNRIEGFASTLGTMDV